MQSSFVVYSCDESHRIDDSPRKEKRFREEYVAKEKKISMANTWRIRRNCKKNFVANTWPPEKKKFQWRIRGGYVETAKKNFLGEYVATKISVAHTYIQIYINVRGEYVEFAAHCRKLQHTRERKKRTCVSDQSVHWRISSRMASLHARWQISLRSAPEKPSVSSAIASMCTCVV